MVLPLKAGTIRSIEEHLVPALCVNAIKLRKSLNYNGFWGRRLSRMNYGIERRGVLLNAPHLPTLFLLNIQIR